MSAFSPGSNNWVVSGAHTVSGKPLLSNDMHLDLRMPEHLVRGASHSRGLRRCGCHPARRALSLWDTTSTSPGDSPISALTSKTSTWRSSTISGEYLTPQGWKQPEHRKEIIRVKGKPDVNLDVAITRHGPIITAIVPGETRQLALKWTSTTPVLPAVSSMRSTRRGIGRSFAPHYRKFSAPGQNVVYADTEGNIGYQATGRFRFAPPATARSPCRARMTCHEWTGYVPFDKMPSVYDPPSGVIATANGRVTPKDYPYTAGHRVERALSGAAHLQAAECQEEAHRRRHADHPDRRAVRVRSLLRAALCLRHRPYAPALRPAPRLRPT